MAQKVKNLQCGRTGSNPWVSKILWRRGWLPTPEFLPGEFWVQRSLVSSSPWGYKESDRKWGTNSFTFIFNMIRSVPVREKVFNKVIIFPLLSYLPVLTSLFQFNSVAQLCRTLCDPMDCSTPGLPVPHQLPELTQTHVHWVCDAIQPSHPLSTPSPPALNISQHQDLFQWVSSSHQVAKVLELQLQHQSFQWIFMTDFL